MNAMQVSETLQRNFIRYLLTTFNVARSDAALAAEIRRQFELPGALFRGPFLELNPPYVKGAFSVLVEHRYRRPKPREHRVVIFESLRLPKSLYWLYIAVGIAQP